MDDPNSSKYVGRLIAWRWEGDVILGYHVRDRQLEVDAAREAMRCLMAKQEPPRGYAPLPKVAEGAAPVDVEDEDTAAYFKRRVFENWEAMREVYRAAKARRPGARSRKEVRS